LEPAALTLNVQTAETLAREFLVAQRTRAPIEPIGTAHAGLTLADAYRVQAASVALRRAQGWRVAGMKVGSTSRVAQERFGVKEPVCGHLFEEQRVANGGALAVANLIHPKIECEIAFRLGRDLKGLGITAKDALAAVAGIMGAFEIIDSRTRDWKIGAVELVADNAVNAGFVLGPERPLDGLDPATVAVAFARNGGTPSCALGAAVLGNPANVLAWLANWFGQQGMALPKDSVVLTGSLGEIHPAAAGDRFEAAFDPLGTVSVSFA
jgi:2-keto-4-pentenoate hydratase